MTRQLVPLTEVPQHRAWANVRWLRERVYRHEIPFHKVGGRVLIDLGDLDALAEAGRVEPTTPPTPINGHRKAVRPRAAS